MTNILKKPLLTILFIQYIFSNSKLNILESKQTNFNQQQVNQNLEQNQILSTEHLYQEKNTDQEALKKQQRLAKAGFESCLQDTNIMQYLSQFQSVGEGAFGSVIIAPIDNQSEQKYAFKIQQYQSSQSDVYLQEVKLSKVIRDLQIQHSNLKVPIYYGCYTGSINNKYYLILQYQVLGSELDLYMDDDSYNLKNDPRTYLNYSKEIRIQNFVNLFNTLYILHQNKIILRDIKPANIMTDVNLKTISATNKPPNSLYFIDFGFALQNETRDNLAGTPAYIHPQCFYSSRAKIVDKSNDVYALCYSYFIIEDYGTLQINGYNIQGMNFKFETDIDMDELKLKNKQQRAILLNKHVKLVRKLIYQQFLNKAKFTNQKNLDNELFQCIQSNDDLDTKAINLANICQNDKECIFYAGFQDEQKDTPSVELLFKAMQISGNNRLRNL